MRAPEAEATPRDRVLTAVALLSVVAAMAAVALAVSRRGVALAPIEATDTLAAPIGARPSDRGSVGAAPVNAEADDPRGPSGGHAPSWMPAPLPEEDTSSTPDRSAGAVTTLKKCCETLRAGTKRTFVRASDACDRVLASVASRPGPMSDALAAAALDAVHRAIGHEPKAASVPAACR
jgi:hypothetical protein